MIIIGGDINIEKSVIEGEVVTETDVISGAVSISTSPPYRGEYEFTPSAVTQTIAIAGLVAKTDITIDPIPSNYGLITWDGAVITVS